MDRNNYGWGSMSSSRGSSSRKGKKDKHRQPQRGLGVAELEKIRLQGEMVEYQHTTIQSPFSNLNMSDTRDSAPVSSPTQTYAAQTTVPMSFGRPTIGAFYSEAQSNAPAVRPLLSTAPCNIYQANVHGHSTVTLPLLEVDREDYMRHYYGRWSTDSQSPNSNSSDTQDLDLELKL